jgi:mRNA interferase RelE/StbE
VGEGHRVDIGEYRIFYVVDDPGRTVNVLLVGKRNDEAIYKQAKRLGLM